MRTLFFALLLVPMAFGCAVSHVPDVGFAWAGPNTKVDIAPVDLTKPAIHIETQGASAPFYDAARGLGCLASNLPILGGGARNVCTPRSGIDSSSDLSPSDLIQMLLEGAQESEDQN